MSWEGRLIFFLMGSFSRSHSRFTDTEMKKWAMCSLHWWIIMWNFRRTGPQFCNCILGGWQRTCEGVFHGSWPNNLDFPRVPSLEIAHLISDLSVFFFLLHLAGSNSRCSRIDTSFLGLLPWRNPSEPALLSFVANMPRCEVSGMKTDTSYWIFGVGKTWHCHLADTGPWVEKGQVSGNFEMQVRICVWAQNQGPLMDMIW